MSKATEAAREMFNNQSQHKEGETITTREALKAYDPDLYALVDETMAYREKVDWRVKR